MTRAPWILAALLLALGTALVPTTAGAHREEHLAATLFVPQDADCASDDDAPMHLQGDGSLTFPEDGCSASYDTASLVASGLTVTTASFRISGHDGSLCGWLEFGGAAIGKSAIACVESPAGGAVLVPVHSATGTGTTLTVTWHAIAAATDDADLCWVGVAYDSAVDTSLGDPDCFGVAAQPHPACMASWAEANPDGTVTVTWPADDQANGYRLLQGQVLPTTEGFGIVTEVDALADAYTFTNLTAGATYGFAVASLRPDDSGWSCVAFAQVAGETAQVPDFPTLASWVAVIGIVALAAFAIVRRSPGKDKP